MLEWDDLRYVLAVAEAGTLSGGAKALGVSHPTVHRRLAAIEARIGVLLFERRPDGYSATPAGEEMRELAATMRAAVGGLEQRLAGRDARPAGTVRITAPDTLAAFLLPDALAPLRRTQPEIVIELVVANEFLSLTKREADIAVRPTEAPPEALVGRRIGTIESAIYGPIGMNDMAARDWIGFDDSLSHLKAAEWLAKSIPEERIVTRCNSLLAALGAARAGIGCAVLPTFLGDKAFALTRLQPPIAELATPLWLLTHREIRHLPRVRAVLDHLAGAVRSRL